MSREYTAEEVRQQVLEHVKGMVDYWTTLPGIGLDERCDGVAFSVLSMLDGCAGLPAFRVSVISDPEDKEARLAEGQNWYPPDLAINEDCELHDEYSQMKWGKKDS